MAPVRFDDIPKTATEVLNDDYQLSGYLFKAKQKASWQGAVLTSSVDLCPAKDSCKTPAKLAWRLPTPLGCSFFCVDKVELDKGGKVRLELSSDKVLGDKSLKVDAKGFVSDPAATTTSATYTGVKDLQVKFETKPMNPQDCSFEATYAAAIQGASVTCGLKGTAATVAAPDLGARVLFGPVFASLVAKQKLSVCTASCMYKVSDQFKCAATYELGGKASGSFTLGCAYDVVKGTKVKAKVQQDQCLSCSVKHEVSKGFTMVAGAKFDVKKMDVASYGLQLSIE